MRQLLLLHLFLGIEPIIAILEKDADIVSFFIFWRIYISPLTLKSGEYMS